MRKLMVIALLFMCKEAYLQCTPANLQATAPLNTPGYALSSSFNSTNASTVTLNGFSNGIISFTGSVGGTARWVNGIRIENDPTADIGNYIYVQPNTTENVTTTNVATYNFTFTEALYNISFRAAGLNNNDQIKVTAFNGATPISVTAANFSNLDAGITVTNGNTLTGTSTAGGTDVNSNRATITFAGPVTSIVMTSGKGNANNTSTVTLGFTSFAYTRCVNVPPDFNNTFVNTAISGNVSTNDVVPTGTLYGTATAQSGNPGAALPTINADGTYTFTSSVAGVFRFTVPMCPPGVVTPNCPNVPLIINVMQPNVYNNNPVANIDRATTQVGTPVTLSTLANDKTGNNSPVALNPASTTVTVAPLRGTASVNATNGNITYTPNAGYTGFDTLTYRICDATSPTPLCATSLQIITIQAATASNNTAASDDYNAAPRNTPISGNVRTNDNDPQGNTQTVTAQTTTSAGKGTLVLSTTGAYTFTPVNGYSGPVSFPYQVCDDFTPSACTNATLYLLVYPTFVLPLNIISFNAATANSDVVLTWASERQIAVSHFEIERSANDLTSFSKVGEVPVNNTSDGTYRFTDVNAKAVLTKGWYRLKIVDTDGKVAYSKVVMATFTKGLQTDVRPTLVQAGKPLQISAGSSTNGKVYSGYLYSSSGLLVQSWEAPLGVNKQVETDKLSAGIYYVKLVTENETTAHKITVY